MRNQIGVGVLAPTENDGSIEVDSDSSESNNGTSNRPKRITVDRLDLNVDLVGKVKEGPYISQ